MCLWQFVLNNINMQSGSEHPPQEGHKPKQTFDDPGKESLAPN